jgi:hypothetical protein
MRSRSQALLLAPDAQGDAAARASEAKQTASAAPPVGRPLSLAPDAHGHLAATPPSRSRMPTGSGTATETSSGSGYAVEVAPNAAPPMSTRSFEVSKPSSPTSLAGANRSCAAPFSVPRGSITAP